MQDRIEALGEEVNDLLPAVEERTFRRTPQMLSRRTLLETTLRNQDTPGILLAATGQCTL